MTQYLNVTASWISSVKPPEKGRDYYRDKAIRQLEICVPHTGKITFYRYGRVNGRMTRIKIAGYPEITVKAAKDICQRLNADVAIGREVQLTHRKTKGAKTVGEVFAWYLDHHAKQKKKSWRRDEKTWIRDVSHWKNRSLDDIKRPEIIELIQQVTAKHGPGPGNKVLDLIRILFSMARQNEWTTKNPTFRIEGNNIEPRERFLLPDEVPAFFTALNTFEERIQDFFLLCIYTGARRSNVQAMRRDAIDLDRRVWSIPSGSIKNKKPLVIPLATQAFEIIARRITNNGDSPWIFPSVLSSSGHLEDPNEAWVRIKEKANLKDLRIHDLRRTLGSWQANADVSLQIIGKSLGHLDMNSTLTYAHLMVGPVRQAIQSTTSLIEAASERIEKNSENGKQ